MPHQSPPGIFIRNLVLKFGNAFLFRNLSFNVEAGQFSALLGPSGVGKTSLLRLIAGLQTADGGRVSASDGAPLAGRIAYMAQNDLLLPWARAVDNVMLGARLRGEVRDTGRAMQLLGRVGLAARALALPAQLSGGERQRVALARTLYEDRPIVLMDEPFSALDAITRARIQDLAAELLAGRTVLLITHDPLEACRLGHVFAVISGSPAQISSLASIACAPPRPPDDPLVLQTQGQLLRQLRDQAGP